MGRRFGGHSGLEGSLLSLLELLHEFAVLELHRENTLLQVGNDPVEGVNEVFAVRDAFFQLLPGCLRVCSHALSVAQSPLSVVRTRPRAKQNSPRRHAVGATYTDTTAPLAPIPSGRRAVPSAAGSRHRRRRHPLRRDGSRSSCAYRRARRHPARCRPNCLLRPNRRCR